MKEVVIVIPVYKSTIDRYEEICLRQCAKILEKYPKALVHPDGLDISVYKNILGEQLMSVSFSKYFFASIQSYNRLLTSLNFYQTFEKYEYMLLHQSDAYVFRDELEEWCNKAYDYIGAPIYVFDGTIAPKSYMGIGNGGFSLRKIKTFIKILHTYKRVYTIKDLNLWYLRYNMNGRIRYFFYYIRILIGLGGNAYYKLNYSKVNEDVFWGVQVPKAFPAFKIASFEDAYKFAMEYNCEHLFELNNRKLPFGCHQWYKGDFLNFWEKYIDLNESITPAR